jgi:hypothetical protein
VRGEVHGDHGQDRRRQGALQGLLWEDGLLRGLGIFMNSGIIESKSSQFYLVSVFYRMPYPFLSWPVLILVVNIFLYFYQKILVGNIFFSIIALLLTIAIYENNGLFMDNFMYNYRFFKTDDRLRKKLKRMNRLFFGKIQFFAITLVIAVRSLISMYFFIFEEGYFFNDVITTFLILSLIFTFIGITLSLYHMSSHGVCAKYSFELYYIYIDVYYQVIFNTVLIGAILTIFGFAVLLWGYMIDQIELGTLVTGPIFSLIILNFLIGIFGIRNGISRSKKFMLFTLSEEITNIENKYNYLTLKDTNESLDIRSQLNTLLSSLISRGKEIEQTREWFFDFWSFISIFIAPIIYTIVRVIIERYLTS